MLSHTADLNKIVLRALRQDERILVAGTPLIDIYDAGGRLLGPLSYLVQDAVNLDAVRARLLFEAHKHFERDQVKGFSVEVPVAPLGYHIQRSESGDLHLLEDLIIWGDFAASQTEVPLILTKLGGRVYGAAEAPVAGQPAVWVGTTNLEAQSTTISWQVTSSTSSKRHPGLRERPIHIPALLDLFPSPDENAPTDERPSATNDQTSAG